MIQLFIHRITNESLEFIEWICEEENLVLKWAKSFSTGKEIPILIEAEFQEHEVVVE